MANAVQILLCTACSGSWSHQNCPPLLQRAGKTYVHTNPANSFLSLFGDAMTSQKQPMESALATARAAHHARVRDEDYTVLLP